MRKESIRQTTSIKTTGLFSKANSYDVRRKYTTKGEGEDAGEFCGDYDAAVCDAIGYSLVESCKALGVDPRE